MREKMILFCVAILIAVMISCINNKERGIYVRASNMSLSDSDLLEHVRNRGMFFEDNWSTLSIGELSAKEEGKKYYDIIVVEAKNLAEAEKKVDSLGFERLKTTMNASLSFANKINPSRLKKMGLELIKIGDLVLHEYGIINLNDRFERDNAGYAFVVKIKKK